MGEIHELFVLALSLVWFAGATPDSFPRENRTSKNVWDFRLEVPDVLLPDICGLRNFNR